MGFLRPLILFFVVLVAVHLGLRLWLRLRERRRLAEEWERGPQVGDRDGFMAQGMAEYDRSFRKRLLWLTIVAPMAGLMVLLYVLNVS
jgi:Mg2+/citrate symporter